MIPKIIWQTHNYMYQELPHSLKKCSETWINLNPGWEYRYVDHVEREKFVKENDLELYNIYKTLKPIAQSDIWRILTIYKYGGGYADMDSVCIKSLDTCLKDKQEYNIVTTEYDNKSGYLNTAHFAAIKECSILFEAIKKIKNTRILDPEWHCWIMFRNAILVGSNVSHGFDATIHSKDYNQVFPHDLEVLYLEEKIRYNMLLERLSGQT